jgi:hypothetical protein
LDEIRLNVSGFNSMPKRWPMIELTPRTKNWSAGLSDYCHVAVIPRTLQRLR